MTDQVKSDMEHAIELRDEQLSKHTPGPWYIVHEGDAFPVYICTDTTRHLDSEICVLFGHFPSANAALIARAPGLLTENIKLREQVRELVAALEEICQECQQTNGGEGAALPFTVHLWDIARSALSKVKAS